jgi:hypothetical protein
MMIVLDCPGCGKRYEVDSSLAGKKSRCKDCGSTFRIPEAGAAPTAAESQPRPTAPGRATAPASPPIIPSGAARGTIVFNCPRCFKRYEVDATLAGKKSRCKDCKEIFTIPPPLSAPSLVQAEPAPAVKKPSLGARNFVVIPEEVVPGFQEVEDIDEFEPLEALRRAPAPPVLDEEPVSLAPRRADFPERPRRTARREVVDSEVGVTVAGAYVALGILAFITLAIWHAAGEPGEDRVGRVFGASLLILYVLGLLIATWASIWLLVIAFRDKVEQGLLCLLVPCYSLYYMISRWRETRGVFAMSFAPGFVIILFALFGGFVLGVTGPSAFVTGIRDRLQSIVPAATSRADPQRVAEAEKVFREYIFALNRLTSDLSRLQPLPAGRRNANEIQMRLRSVQESALQLMPIENRAKATKVSKDDMVELRKSIGAEMRAAVIALKYEVTRIKSLPGMEGSFPTLASDLDRMLVIWEATADGEGGTALVQQPPSQNVAPNPGLGQVPGAFPPGGHPQPRGFPPGGSSRRFETFEAHYDRLRGQYGDRAVMVVLSGLPVNSDGARGVTKRDVEDAIDKRLATLARGATQSMSTGSGDLRSICLAPVEDVKRLADSIDFGKASSRGSRIDVVVSSEYIASVPRTPAGPSIAAGPHNGRDDEPQVPANSDPITKSMIQLKSPNNGRKKEALERLIRVRPSERLNEVLATILPLLEQDDEDLIKHVVRVLAVWQSPEAMAKLIDMVNDPRVFLRWELIKALGKYDDPKSAEALIGRFKEDGHLVEQSLKSMGPIAEPPLIALLRNPDADLRKKACEVLKFVGGAATLKAMRALPPDPEFFVRVAAQDAVKMINLRVGPAASGAPEQKKADPPAAGRSRKK